MSWCALNKNEMLEKISVKYVTKKYTGIHLKIDSKRKI